MDGLSRFSVLPFVCVLVMIVAVAGIDVSGVSAEPEVPEVKVRRISPGPFSSSRPLWLSASVSEDPANYEIRPFAVAQPLTGSLDFNPRMERYYFNAADWTVGSHGIFPQVSTPYSLRWHLEPICLSGPFVQTLPVLPQISPERREVGLRSDGMLTARFRPIGWSDREFALMAGDEAGDAMMLDFVDPQAVDNRGSLLGADVTIADVVGRNVSWWAHGGYRKNDWLAFRRHAGAG